MYHPSIRPSMHPCIHASMHPSTVVLTDPAYTLQQAQHWGLQIHSGTLRFRAQLAASHQLSWLMAMSQNCIQYPMVYHDRPYQYLHIIHIYILYMYYIYNIYIYTSINNINKQVLHWLSVTWFAFPKIRDVSGPPHPLSPSPPAAIAKFRSSMASLRLPAARCALAWCQAVVATTHLEPACNEKILKVDIDTW